MNIFKKQGRKENKKLFQGKREENTKEIINLIDAEKELEKANENDFQLKLEKEGASSLKVLINPQSIRQIQETLMIHHSDKMIKALDDPTIKSELREIISAEWDFNNQQELDYILSEIVGTGFVERLLKQSDVTDIGWNGVFLVVETPYSRITYTKDELGLKDVDEYINRLVAKYANAVGKAFNDTHPILDAAYNNVRLNAMHKTRSPDGTTISLRVVRETLAITEENFDYCFAPLFVLDFIKSIMRSGCNLVISGITGTGKTELQKLAFSYVNPNEKIITIEDVREMHLKKLYPDNDILSWVTSTETTIAHEVAASLRNNPRWVVVSETRGAEAYEMYGALTTGQRIVTTLHADNANMIPRRFVSMCMGAYSIDEKMLTYDILKSFNFGFHIKRVNYKGVTLRFLEEIVEFDPAGNTTLFKQVFENGKFYCTSGAQVSEEIEAKMAEANVPVYAFPINDHIEVEKKIMDRIPEHNKETEAKRKEIKKLLEDANEKED